MKRFAAVGLLVAGGITLYAWRASSVRDATLAHVPVDPPQASQVPSHGESLTRELLQDPPPTPDVALKELAGVQLSEIAKADLVNSLGSMVNDDIRMVTEAQEKAERSGTAEAFIALHEAYLRQAMRTVAMKEVEAGRYEVFDHQAQCEGALEDGRMIVWKRIAKFEVNGDVDPRQLQVVVAIEEGSSQEINDALEALREVKKAALSDAIHAWNLQPQETRQERFDAHLKAKAEIRALKKQFQNQEVDRKTYRKRAAEIRSRILDLSGMLIDATHYYASPRRS